jgi:phosphoribosylformylglycinamidine (FGAM) synthase PurS component
MIKSINTMSKDKGKVIDYLSEDPEISGQKFALVSIVGPHMPQKCDVWGLKVRGVADSVAEAKQMTKRLMKFDNMYDIYTVSVGKFFPLNVEPYDVKDVEHNDEKLNELMKSYLKNREDANEHYHQRN